MIGTIFSQRQADQAAPFLGHEVNRFRRHQFGSHAEVAFIFAVFIVNQDHHLTLANIFKCFFDTC